MDPIVGIDLGTTNTCVAIVEDGVPIIIPNRAGEKTAPSVVAVSESGRRLVGQLAKRQAVSNPKNTVSAVKRLIGRTWSSDAVQHARKNCVYDLVAGLTGDVRIQIKGEALSVPEISAMTLQEMKLAAEAYLGVPVEKAVITVPAYFNDGQRQATVAAGQIAGLQVQRIINEPTAAALAFGFGKGIQKTVAIYDLGGGTFDISILRIEGEVFEVISTVGDAYLGGEDFDARVMEQLAAAVPKGMEVDARGAKVALQRMKDAAEQAKRELSFAPEAKIDLPFLFTTPDEQIFHMQKVLKREQLELLTHDLVDRTIDLCRKTLEEAELKTSEIGEVLLVGGMTRMPMVRRMVKEFFGIEPSKNIHPDEAVALGAAIQADILHGEAGDLVLLDVTPHPIGIMVAGGDFYELISANASVPTSASHVFTTVRSNQSSIRIVVMQGTNEEGEYDQLGEFLLSGIRKGSRADVDVEVTFLVSADNIVSVEARDVETGKAQNVTVVASSGISEDELAALVERHQGYLADEREHQRAELPISRPEPEGGWADLTEEVAEVRFYLTQGLEDDARMAYEELQGAHAGHPDVLQLARELEGQ